MANSTIFREIPRIPLKVFRKIGTFLDEVPINRFSFYGLMAFLSFAKFVGMQIKGDYDGTFLVLAIFFLILAGMGWTRR